MDSLQPSIKTISEKTLFGLHIANEYSAWSDNNFVAEFLDYHFKIDDRISDHLISLQINDEEYFTVFNPSRPFAKWVPVEVCEVNDISSTLNSLILGVGYIRYSNTGFGCRFPHFPIHLCIMNTSINILIGPEATFRNLRRKIYQTGHQFKRRNMDSNWIKDNLINHEQEFASRPISREKGTPAQ